MHAVKQRMFSDTNISPITLHGLLEFFFLLENLYSDSTFYDTEDERYPTIPQQMQMCKMISQILEAPDAMRSRGGKMYFKRKMKSDQWAKEAMGRKVEHPYGDYYDGGECAGKLQIHF